MLLDEDISIKLVNILTIKQEKNHDIEQTKKLLHEHMNLFFQIQEIDKEIKSNKSELLIKQKEIMLQYLDILKQRLKM